MSDNGQDRRPVLAGITFFAVIVLLVTWDLILDYEEGASREHMGIELIILFLSTSGIGLLWAQLKQAQTHLAQALVEAEQWRSETRELMLGLGIAIENQFVRWQLTKAEAEVGLLLLKGFSHKEIARLRQTSERTTRKQAGELYRKSGLSGRSSLSSFFLEDLLLPAEGTSE